MQEDSKRRGNFQVVREEIFVVVRHECQSMKSMVIEWNVGQAVSSKPPTVLPSSRPKGHPADTPFL